jgi:GR25 family glycosyltransferase involved in LPS biosynthesis
MVNNKITHTFVIGNKEREPDRISYLEQYFESINYDAVSYFQPTYKDTINDQILNKFIPVNESIHGRPLTIGEISLFLNWIYLFEKIVSEYTDGMFLILESDVVFTNDLSIYLDKLVQSSNIPSFDCISIGSGCNLIPPNTILSHNEFQFEYIPKTRCIDSLLFTYKGIKDIYTYFIKFMETNKSINEPIDNFIDTFLQITPSYQYIWVYPHICVQGSEHGVYTPSVRT